MKSLFKRFSKKTDKLRQYPPESVEKSNSIFDINSNTPILNAEFAQSKGLQREENEDALFTLNSTIAMQNSIRPFGLFIVADGMGGHLYGEIASKLAIGSISSMVIRRILIPYVNPAYPTHHNSLKDILRESILIANQDVLKQTNGGGTTLTACLVFGSYLTIAHVGDSRAYYIGLNGEIKLYTRDHSLVKRLVELGQINEKEAENHPQRNVLYQALGQHEPLEPDLLSLPLPQSGYLLLCTDGLWNVVSDELMSEIILQSANLQTACDGLIQAANQAGGPDNISVILVKFNS